jgi:hypothetical protein
MTGSLLSVVLLRATLTSNILVCITCAGCNRNLLCCNSIHRICASSLLHDWFRMDCRKVLLLLLLRLHELYLFFTVWDDACCIDSCISNCWHCYDLLLQFLESVLRLPHCTSGMYINPVTPLILKKIHSS